MTGNSNDIAISALGVHSSLGGSMDAAAAFRCGLSRGQELQDWPYFDEETLHEHLLIGHPAAGLSDGFQGLGRFVKMGAYALEDMRQHLNSMDINPAKLGIFFVFPITDVNQAISADLKNEFGIFLTRLQELCWIKVEKKNTRAYFEGRLGVISAIQDAQKFLKDGNIDYCLIGAIDTLLDSQRLSDFLIANKVKTMDNPTGLVPGEAACFILLERLSSTKHRENIPEVVLQQPSLVIAPDKDDDSEQIPTGCVLCEAMVGALDNAQATATDKGTIYCDMNGEDFKAADFGGALVRASSHYLLSDWKLEIPALSFGETGAASGMIAICLAFQAFSRGYLFGDKALVVMSSEQGHSGAIVLRRV